MRLLCIDVDKSPNFNKYFTLNKSYKIIHVGKAFNRAKEYIVIRDDGYSNTLTEGSWLRYFRLTHSFTIPIFYYKLTNLFKA